MKIHLVLLLLLTVFSIALPKEEVIFKTYFTSKNFGGTIESGSGTFSVRGLHLKPNSRLTLSIPEARKIIDGSIHLAFITPAPDNNLIPTVMSSKECFCALKIRMGLCEVEFAEKWIRVQQFKKNVTNIEKVLAQVNREIEPESREYKAKIVIKRNQLTLFMNENKVLNTVIPKHDFTDLAITTFKEPFDITSLSLYSPQKNGYIIDKLNKLVDVVAQFHSSRFNRGFGLKDHHFIVWESGNAVANALFTTFVSDSVLHRAIEEVGGKPGNNLSQEAWTKRKSKKSQEPDKRATGSKIDLQIIYGNMTFTPDQVLSDLNSKQYDFRFAGNISLIHHWRSGCVVCLQSCPGGKIGNSTYTIRDLVKGVPKFKVAPGLPFGEGDKVVIRFQIK